MKAKRGECINKGQDQAVVYARQADTLPVTTEIAATKNKVRFLFCIVYSHKILFPFVYTLQQLPFDSNSSTGYMHMQGMQNYKGSHCTFYANTELSLAKHSEKQRR